MLDSFSPREKVLSILAYWSVVAAAAILGGLAGLAIYALKAPVYEAQAHIAIGIDFTRTGYMEQYDKDLALGSAAGVIFSTEVMQQVVDAAGAENIPVDFDSLFKAATIERRTYEWILRVRFNDPDQAAFIANRWMELGVIALDSAYQHALAADAIATYLDSLESCLEQVAVNAIVPVCPYNSVGELQADLSTTEEQFFLEKQAARGLFPGVTYQVNQRATPPLEPVLYGRNNLALAGLLIGLIVGSVMVSTGLPARWSKRI